MSDRVDAVNAWEALFRAQVTVLRALHAEFPNGELSLNEYDVLFNLSRQPDHQLRIRDINKHLLLTQPSVSRLVDRLAARDLLRKASDPGDGRGTIVSLTEAGYALFRKVALTHSASIVRQMENLSPKELATLTTLTDKLRRSAEG
ncbi:MAG: MarR family transcriptional regulator [Rhodoglobus sp.]